VEKGHMKVILLFDFQSIVIIFFVKIITA